MPSISKHDVTMERLPPFVLKWSTYFGKRHLISTLVLIRLYVYLGAFLGLLVALSSF